MKKYFLLTVIAMLLTNLTRAQHILPIVGKPMPYFELNDVHYYTKKKVTLADFKGQWLILDFFTQNCLVCFASFPKIDKLREEFKNKIQFLLVGDNEQKYGKNVRTIFERIRAKQELGLSVAYDSVTFKKWDITAVPYVIVIDDKGIVRAINNSQDINSANLNALLKGETGSFRKIDYEPYNDKKPLLVNNNGGVDSSFLYRSILYKWKRPMTMAGPVSISAYKRLYPGFQTLGAPLEYLYQIAYFDRNSWSIEEPTYGNVARLPIFEDIPQEEYAINNKGDNLYCYSLTVPKEKATTMGIMTRMQHDLKDYFGYEAGIETRKMPYWKLIATGKAKKELITKDKKTQYYNAEIKGTGVEYKNYPLSVLLHSIFWFHQHQPAFIDESGITENIDVKLDAVMTDFEDIKRGLKKCGLELVKAEKDMQVLVIRKPESIKANFVQKP